MDKYKGRVASKGIAVGTIKELSQKDNVVRREKILDVESEKTRFEKAQEVAVAQFDDLYTLAVKEVGEANALIFEIHKMLIEDEDYVNSVVNIIETQKVNAEYAVAVTGDNFAQTFASMDDDYMKERAADIKDITERLVNVLSNKQSGILSFETACIIVADDLSPSETVQMDKSKILAFVTRKGSVNSHTAILSRTMAIPAIVAVDIPFGLDGKECVVNGFSGEFIVNPDGETLNLAENIAKKENKRKKLLNEYKGKETITKSGKKINLYANVGSVGDIGLALQNDAEGIGLFRSEFLYLEQSNLPSEDLQFAVYKQAVEMMAGKKVIIRTMDIGADKQTPYFNMGEEENPALGYRAIRICLTEQEILITQLRALIRASLYGKIAIMIPMIASVWEVVEVKKVIEEIKLELDKQGISYGDFEFGIMIETPAAVMIADELAKHVDFFSIGTNDLTQYTIAVDRQNQKLEKFYDARHPAVLKMIKIIAETAKINNIWSGICGELAADEELTETFIQYGIDELSVTPSAVLPIRQIIRNLL